MAMLRSFLLLLMIFPLGNAKHTGNFIENCPNGWTNFGSRCYKFFPQMVNWITAEKHCQTLGANLASVHSKREHDFLMRLVPATATYSWVGAHDGAQEGQWLWTDGSIFYFTDWCSQQPDNYYSGENCMHLIPYKSCWNDLECSAKMGYICATKEACAFKQNPAASQ